MEIPSFVRLQDSLGEQGFQILGLNYEQSDDAAANLELVQKSISELGINYPCILIDQKFLEQIPNMRGFPTTLFLDKQGRVRHVATGVHSYNYLQSVVKTLMQESAS